MDKLVELGFVHRNRSARTYKITPRGRQALDLLVYRLGQVQVDEQEAEEA